MDVGVGRGAADVGRSEGRWWRSGEASQALHISPIKRQMSTCLDKTGVCDPYGVRGGTAVVS